MTLSTLLVLLAGGSAIGFLLAVLGAGGAILLLPLLVGVLDLPTDPAIALSLLIVMVLAIGNAIPYLRRRQFAPRPALQLGLPSLLGSWWGARLARTGVISDNAQLVIFIGAALVAAVLMLRKANADDQAVAHLPLIDVLRPKPLPWLLPVQGLLVGLLTGTAGVGGGFAIVPALVLLAGLPMPLATGTSLVLIALSSPVALITLGHWPIEQLPLILPILAGGLLGALIGQRLAAHLNDRLLRRGFAALLIGSALFTAAETLQRSRHGRLPSSHNAIHRHDHPSRGPALRRQPNSPDV